MTSFNRRQFLNTSLGLVTASAVGGSLLNAADPIKRIEKTYFKLSLAAYSMRQYMTQNHHSPKGKEGTMTLLDYIEQCAKWNTLDAVELTSYYFPKEVKTAYLNQVKELTFRLGLDISGTAIGNNFCVKETAERDQQLQLTHQWIDYAAIMGAPVIRIFAGTVPKGDTEEAAVARCIECLNEVTAYAESKGVILALENHGGITSTPEQLLKLVHTAKSSPYLGINFDSGNFRTADPYGDLAKIAPFAYNAQVKVEISPNGKKELADLERIVKILDSVHYRGYIVLEYEAAEEPMTAIPEYLQKMRSILKSYS